MASALTAGRTAVADVVGAARARIAEHAARLGAFEYTAEVTSVVEDLDRELARGAGRPRGALHGIPLTVKDVIDVAGMPTTGSSRAMAARVAARDATAVGRLRNAGAVIVGKAATHEFALGVTTPQARSPWDEERVPGGSSGGSAISLVTGMALGSLGTDTRASIRVPAALCGVVGFKPSLGVVPVDGWLTLSWSMDHLAPMARSVRDIAVLMDVLTDRGDHHRSLLPGSLEGLRVGSAAACVEGCEPGISRCFENSLAAMRKGGATVTSCPSPTAGDLQLANAAGMVVSRSEAAQFHAEAGTHVEHCTTEVRDQLREARSVTATDYVRAMRLRGQLRERLLTAFETVDLLAMPTCTITAPRRSDAGRHLLALSQNCIPWSFVDFPAISVPAGTSDGLPVGLQLVGGPGQDDLVLAAAHAFEAVAPPLPLWPARSNWEPPG